MKINHILLRTSALAVCFPGIGHAQDRAPATAEADAGDIVVTARRQSELLKNVPISIIAVDDQTLNERNVKTTNDLPLIAPGLSVQNTSANRNNSTFSIRGQGQTFGQSSPGVVAYFADVPDFATTFYDLENVQVLKGPQGTLFGRNTTGGAILFVPKKPTDDIDGFINLRVGNYNRHDAEFAIGGAIVPGKVEVRFAAQLLNRDGFTTNIANNSRTDNERKQSFRFSLVLRPSGDLENYTIFEYDRADEQGSGTPLGAIDPDNPTLVAAGVVPQVEAYLAAQQARGPRKINTPFVLSNGLKSYGVINTTTYDLGDKISFKNIFSYRRFAIMQDYDIDGTPLPILDVFNPYPNGLNMERTEEFQVHGKFGIIDGVVGFFDDRNTSPGDSIGFKYNLFVDLFPTGLPYAGPASGYLISNGGLNKSRAFYGEFNAHPLDGLTLTAGIRRTRDYRSSSTQPLLLQLPFLPEPIPAGAASSNAGSFKATTWNLAGLYQINSDLNVYATVRRGYKSGGFNGTAPAEFRRFEPETVTDYEVGFKGKWNLGSGVKLGANVDLFYDDYKNIQRYKNIVIPGGAATITTNAAAGNIKGIDVDANLIFGRNFDISARYTYLKTHYDAFDDATLGDLSNSRFPNSPTHQLTVTPRVILPTPEDKGQISLLANIFYQSMIAFDPANRPNGNPATLLSSYGALGPAYTRVDLRADWSRFLGTNLSIAAYVRNVTNKAYIVGSDNQLPTFGTVTYLYGEPRTFGAELRFNF